MFHESSHYCKQHIKSRLWSAFTLCLKNMHKYNATLLRNAHAKHFDFIVIKSERYLDPCQIAFYISCTLIVLEILSSWQLFHILTQNYFINAAPQRQWKQINLTSKIVFLSEYPFSNISCLLFYSFLCTR